MSKFETSPSLPVNFHGLCIRFDESGAARQPRIHENGSHACVGIDNIAVNTAGELVITLQKDALGQPFNIISMNANFDESMSQLGWDLGLTSGVGAATLRLSKDGVVKPCTHTALYGEFNNIWVQIFTIAKADTPVPVLKSE